LIALCKPDSPIFISKNTMKDSLMQKLLFNLSYDPLTSSHSLVQQRKNVPVDSKGLIQSQLITKYEGSLVREIACGDDWNLLRNWVGQFRVAVNPKTNSIDISLFDYGITKLILYCFFFKFITSFLIVHLFLFYFIFFFFSQFHLLLILILSKIQRKEKNGFQKKLILFNNLTFGEFP